MLEVNHDDVTGCPCAPTHNEVNHDDVTGCPHAPAHNEVNHDDVTGCTMHLHTSQSSQHPHLLLTIVMLNFTGCKLQNFSIFD